MTKEALTLALEALIWADAKGENWEKVVSKAIQVAQEALSSPNGEAQPEQRNVSEHLEHVACVTYKEVADTMNGLWGGTIVQRQIAEELGNIMLYTTPQQPKEPEQEPDTLNYTVHVECKRCGSHERYDLEIDAPTTQRKPLTDDEWFEFWQVSTALDDCEIQEFPHFLRLVRAIQAHKIKE